MQINPPAGYAQAFPADAREFHAEPLLQQQSWAHRPALAELVYDGAWGQACSPFASAQQEAWA